MKNGKTALITGASRGIGREVAFEFARAGYSLALNYSKNDEYAKTVLSEIGKLGGEAALYKCDVSKHADVKTMVEDVVLKYGKIDVLINNAAITRHRTILKMSDEEWNNVIDTDLTGPFYVMKEYALAMAVKKDGVIINISSITAFRGALGAANYAAAKAGLLALTKSAAIEFGRHNIRVNSVLPGFHLTSMGEDASRSYKERAVQESVLGLTTDIKELAEFIRFLSGTKTVSGQVFNWDSRVI
jgi:3-oxoacyl-[acyl-carrier protein] reductase